MGAGSSVAQVFRKDNPRLKLFVSGKSIPSEADSLKAYFTSLLDFDIVNSSATEKEVEEIASEFCKGLGMLWCLRSLHNRSGNSNGG